MEGFRTYSGYKVGASHIAKSMNCEDYAATFDNEKVSVAVISDGHGDRKCFRSAKGAHIACDVSIECVRKIIDGSSGACDALKKSPDRIITELERNIIYTWNKGIETDLKDNPIAENELEGLPTDAVEAIRSGHSLNKIYGCTLIMCVVIEDFWFGIHIGDGKCVVALKNGQYTQPIPWDEIGCVGNRSTSICNSNSFAGFRYIYDTDVPSGLFVASDGVDESFDESGLNRCYYTLGYWVQTMSRKELDSKTEELLSQITNNGSGDDVSIACILSERDAIKKPYATSEQVAEKLIELINNIKDKENQFDSLTDSKRDVSTSLNELELEIKSLEKKIVKLRNQVSDKKQELASIDKNLQYIIAELQKSVIQLPKAKDTKERIDQYWRRNGVNVTEDIRLDYTPRYSEEYLDKVLAEITGLDINDKSENAPETSDIAQGDNGLIKSDGSTEDNNPANGKNVVTVETTKANVPSDESRDEQLKEGNKQIEEDVEHVSQEAELGNQKNSFFGGLFGRKK